MLDLNSKKAKSIVNHKKAKIFIVRYHYKTKVMKATIKDFTGYANLMMMRVKDDQKVLINYKVTSGVCALAYMQKDQFHVIAQETFNEEVVLNVKKGFMRFRVIGNDASIALTMTFI